MMKNLKPLVIFLSAVLLASLAIKIYYDFSSKKTAGKATGNLEDKIKFQQVFPNFPPELIHRLAKRYFETDAKIEGLMVAVQYGLKDQGEPLASGLDILIAIETIFSRLEDTDVIGQLQSITRKPLLRDSAGEPTFIFDEGKPNKPMTALAKLSVIFAESNEAEKGAISIALGSRDYYSEAWAMLNRYQTALMVSIDSIFKLNNQ